MLGVSVMAGTGVVGAVDYDWRPVRIGGVGWTTGLVSHPTEADVRLARTDTGGFHRWDPTLNEWEQLFTNDRFGFTEWIDAPSGTGVESVAIAPSNPDVFYVAAANRLYRSTNGGDSFLPVGPSSIAMEPNGDYRANGERLAVDPLNPNVAYFGSRDAGLYRTTEGLLWNTVSGVSQGTPGLGVGLVKFDPDSPAIGGRTSGIYAASVGAGVYHSSDAGATWSNLSALPGGPSTGGRPSDIELNPHDGSLYVTYEGQGETGLWRYGDGRGWGLGGSDWQQLTPSSGSNHVAVAVDPFNPGRIITGTTGLSQFWLSEDDGSNWRQLSFTRSSPNIPWAEITNERSFSTGEVFFDPVTPNKLWTPQGIGLWKADASPAALSDNELIWENEVQGIELEVPNDVLAMPDGTALIFGWDRTGFRITDPDQYNATQINPRIFSHGWDGAYRPNDPSFVVTNAADYLEARGAPNTASFSTDGGVTWELFPNIRSNHPTELKFGNIAPGVSDANFPENIVWVPAKGPAPYFSNDNGATWNKASGWIQDGGGNDANSGIINEFVKIQGLVAHPEDAGVFYYAAPNLGLTKSVDGGDNWELLFDGFVGFGFNSRLQIDPTDTDTLWYAHGQQSENFRSGLWRSTDGGETFVELTSVDYAIDVSLGAPAPGSTLETLYLVGVVSGQQGIYRSLDDGASWESIGQFTTGLVSEPDRIEASMQTFGLVYLGIEGTGYVYGQLAVEPTPGDYNGDGTVDTLDFDVWRNAFGAVSGSGLAADGNADGVVNAADYTVWRDAFAAGPAAVPEPTAAWLFGAALAAAAARRRRLSPMPGFFLD